MPVEPAPPPIAAVAPPARLLACEAGTAPLAAPHPEPTWACARPDGTHHGAFVTLFPDGTLAIRGAYRDGALDGAWQRFHPGGALAERGAYAAGKKHGAWQRLGPTGTPLGAYTMTAGTGVEHEWLDTGARYRETPYTDGVRDGVATTLSPEGTAWARTTWNAGTLDGVRDHGTAAALRIEETFTGGVRTGTRRIWLQGAKLAEDHFDAQGRLHGAYTLWRSKRLVRTQGQYHHGKRAGRWVWTDRDRRVEREGTYVAGKRDGVWIERTGDQPPVATTYANGQPADGVVQTFHPNGNLWTETAMSGGVEHGAYRELTPRGTVVVAGTYRSGAKHGTWKAWSATGALLLEQHYVRGKLDGIVKKYVRGALASEATYTAGLARGSYREYRDGKPAVSGQFVDDRRDGTWTVRRADGTEATATYRDGVLQVAPRPAP